MYGMVNKFISDMIIRQYGQEKWDEIASQLSFSPDIFMGMQQYDDVMTFEMIGKTVDLCDIAADEFLRLLGHGWVEMTSHGDYKEMFSLSGDNLFDFLKNLNNMHTMLGAQMEGLQPPSFFCREAGDKEILVEYYSERKGLTPFVLGLLQGLCVFFNEKGTVSVLSTKSNQQHFDLFQIALE